MNKYFIFAILFVGRLALADNKALDIMTKNENARKIGDVAAKAQLKIVTKEKTKVKDFSWWRKLQGDGIHFNTFTRFHRPAEIKNEAILFKETTEGQADIQMYLPAYKKVRRVESGQQSGSFMGSDFSYSDIATPHLEDYTYKLLKEESCPTGVGKCFVIEFKPASESVKERTGVSEGTTWVREDNSMSERAEYKDESGALWKKMSASQITEVDTKNHKWMALSVRMENMKNQRNTTLDFSDVKVNQGIKDSLFTVQNLSKEP